jgi:hypothetical protein
VLPCSGLAPLGANLSLGAGHLAELDEPDEVAAAILRWTD